MIPGAPARRGDGGKYGSRRETPPMRTIRRLLPQNPIPTIGGTHAGPRLVDGKPPAVGETNRWVCQCVQGRRNACGGRSFDFSVRQAFSVEEREGGIGASFPWRLPANPQGLASVMGKHSLTA